MRRMLLSIGLLTVLAGVASAADVHVGINIGVPVPPPFVVPAPPQLVVVPTTPAVQYAPDLSFNFFFYGGQYYTYHENAWFVARAYNGPWTYVERAHVPRPVLVVPARYYKISPGHMKQMHGSNPHGMPPGQAKKIYGYEHGHGHHGHGDWD